ncbi:MAG: CBS domain-containing protein [Porticoccaceae bacterium]
MLNSVKLKDHMIGTPVTVLPDVDLFDAVALILDHRISGLCVVDDEGNLVGVLSELDCLRATLSASYENRTRVGTVADYMTKDVIASDLEDDIVEVAADMLKNRHRRRPIVKNGKLVGQITCRQLLDAMRAFSSKP